MKQLIISQNDIYQVGGINYFKFTFANINHRDIPCDLTKTEKYMLKLICKYCELDHKGLKKSQLIDLITNSNCLILN